MKNIEINIGMVCNNRCVFCANAQVRAAGRRFVGPERVISEIDRAAAQGYRALGFLGGEITIYPHAAAIIRAARERGFTRISLCTNGRRLSRPEVLQALLDAGATRFAVSVHSHEADVEDRLNARKGAFAEKLAGIDNLLRAAAAGRIPDGVSLNTCIHGFNHDRLVDLARFFRARGVRDIRFNFLRPEHQAAGNPQLVPRLSACMPEALRLIVACHRGLDMTVTFGDIPLCLWPPRFLADVALARQHIGELRDLDTDVSEFRDETGPSRFNWRRVRSTTLKTHVRACRTCAARAICEGPWAKYLAIHGPRELHPLPRLPYLPLVPPVERERPVRARPPARPRVRTAAKKPAAGRKRAPARRKVHAR